MERHMHGRYMSGGRTLMEGVSIEAKCTCGHLAGDHSYGAWSSCLHREGGVLCSCETFNLETAHPNTSLLCIKCRHTAAAHIGNSMMGGSECAAKACGCREFMPSPGWPDNVVKEPEMEYLADWQGKPAYMITLFNVESKMPLTGGILKQCEVKHPLTGKTITVQRRADMKGYGKRQEFHWEDRTPVELPDCWILVVWGDTPIEYQGKGYTQAAIQGSETCLCGHIADYHGGLGCGSQGCECKLTPAQVINLAHFPKELDRAYKQTKCECLHYANSHRSEPSSCILCNCTLNADEVVEHYY